MCRRIMSLKVREPWRGRQAPQGGDWCRGEREGVWGRPAQPGTHPVSLGSGDTSCSPLAGHALQAWRALSPRGAGWASCTLCGRGLCGGQLLLRAPKAPFLPFFLCPDPFGSHPPPLPPSIFIPQASSPSTQRTTLASLTLGPSVPGVPGRPRGPWRPWEPGEPRSPGKPRSPWSRDITDPSGRGRKRMESQGDAGR